jgi:hypothetical protein
MIEDDFYATLKLKTGEEIFARVAPSEENAKILLIVTNPIIISEVKNRSGISGYKVEPWLKTTTEDMFILNIDDVITISESNDIEMIMIYQKYVRKYNNIKNNKIEVSRKMGYIGNVHDAKCILEKIYKDL